MACVRLKSACVKMAVSQSTNLILAVTDKGIVPYNLKLEEGGVPHFIMPQVWIFYAYFMRMLRFKVWLSCACSA